MLIGTAINTGMLYAGMKYLPGGMFTKALIMGVLLTGGTMLTNALMTQKISMPGSGSPAFGGFNITNPFAPKTSGVPIVDTSNNFAKTKLLK